MKKLLVVDKNELMRRLVKIYLCKCGYQVEMCDGPSKVPSMVREFSPHVILMDLNMSGLSDQSVADMLGHVKSCHGCKLVVFSSEDECVQAEMVERGVADGYFLKSHTLNGLTEKIENLITDMDRCCSSGICEGHSQAAE